VGDLRNKAKKWAEEDRRQDVDRQSNGYTVFHFDFNPTLKPFHKGPAHRRNNHECQQCKVWNNIKCLTVCDI